MSDDNSEGFRNPEKTLEGLSRIYDSLRERLIPYLCGRFRLQPRAAEDLADKALATAASKISKYNPDKHASLDTWVFTIAINLAFDLFKSLEYKKAPASLNDVAMETLQSPLPSPEETYRRKRLAEMLHAALAQQPALQRMAMELCQLQGYRRDEAARILHVSVRRLDEALYQARIALRNNRELWEEYHGCDYTAAGKEAKQGRTRRNERVLRRTSSR